MDDITSSLLIDSVEDSELIELLLEFYGVGAEHSSNETVYYRTGEGEGNYAIKLKWDNPRIQSIETGPAFQSGDLQKLCEKIRRELLTTDQLVGRSILLSGYPVLSRYETYNRFQMLPVPNAAPKIEKDNVPGCAGNPFLLEFSLLDSPNRTIKSQRRQRTALELTLFLNAILAGSISIVGSRYKPKWVKWDDLSTGHEYRYCHEGYSYIGFEVEGTSFTSDQPESMEQVEPSAYYEHSIYSDMPLQIPNTIDELVIRYFALSKENKQRFLRAAFWFHQSQETNSPSASFLSLIFSIDALIPPEKSSTICDKCNQSVGHSLTSRFVKVLDDLVPEHPYDPKDRKTARRELCRVRGDLAHGRDLLSSDKNGWLHSFTPQGIREWKWRMYAASLAKLSIVHWLLRSGQLPSV
jgi:hypothetical protein